MSSVISISLTGNEKRLCALKQELLTLDVQVGWDTPIARLASEGKFEAIDLLLSLGASKDRAVHGAAAGGHYDLQKYLKGYADHFSQFSRKPLASLNLEQRMAWKNKGIVYWLTVCRALEKKLSKDVYFTIATFLTGGKLNLDQLFTLQSTMFYMMVEQKPVVLALDKQVSRLSLASSEDKNLAQAIKGDVLEATTRKELLEALKPAKNQIDGLGDQEPATAAEGNMEISNDNNNQTVNTSQGTTMSKQT